MSRLALYLLGPPRIELDGRPIQISRRKVVALLGYVAVTGTPHSRDALATLFWPERSQSRARAYLRRALSELNRTLGEGFLTIDRETAGLDPNANLWLDVALFHERLAVPETHSHPTTEVCSDCVTQLEDAVELYCDDFMAGFTLRDSPDFDEWQFFQYENLRDELANALARLMRWHSSQREYDPAIAYARRWLALDPLHEPVHRHLMELYAQAGRRAAVERQYQECVQILETELGAPPADATTALYEQLQRRPKEIDDRLFPTAPPRHNLPVQTTPFIGREEELAEIAVLLEDPGCRLLTLIGPGGSGKTRLALEAGAAQLDANGYEHGVFFVSLAPLEDVEAIVPSVADALGFRFYSGGTPQEQLLSYLRQKNLLLIMDNYEHLLEGVGLVSDIIRTAPQVKILATSRARLNVGGEHRFQVEGMDYPGSTLEKAAEARYYSAVELFTLSARRARPDFQLTDDNVGGVLDVCQLVEGMPLAVRLAAAWVAALTPSDIAAEIEQNIDVLATERRDVPERQRSMRAAFDHSWTMLTEREREVMRALSVFRGTFGRKAAQQVSGASLAELMALVDKSLVHSAPNGYFELHELLRQYAAEKLDQTPDGCEAARDHHCAYYASALGKWAVALKGPHSQRALTEIDLELENLRSAWSWAVESTDLGRLVQAVDGLGEYFDARGRWSEGEAVFSLLAEKIQALYGPSPAGAGEARLLASALTWQVILNRSVAFFDYDEHQAQKLRASLALLTDPALAEEETTAEEAFIRQQLGRMLKHSGSRDHNAEGREHLESSLRLYRTLSNHSGAADALYELNFYARVAGESERAKRMLHDSLALQRKTGEPRRITRTQLGLGLVLWDLGEYDEAREVFEQAYDESQAAGRLADMADARRSATFLAWFVGEFDAAFGYIEEALALARRAGSMAFEAFHLTFVGLARAYLGDFARAAALIQEAIDLDPRLNIMWTKSYLAFAHIHAGRYEIGRELSRAVLVEEGSQASAWALHVLGLVALVQGRYSEVLELSQRGAALAQSTMPGLFGPEWRARFQGPMASALHGMGRFDEANRQLCEALQTCVAIRAFLPLIHVLPIMAAVFADDADDVLKRRGVELYAMAEKLPFVANSRWFQDISGKHIAAAAADLPPDVVAAAQERGRARDLWETAEELLDELNA